MKVELNSLQVQAIVYCLGKVIDIEKRDWAREQYMEIKEYLEEKI